MRSPLKAHLLVLSANILYGINYSVGKNALQAMPPFGIVVIRVTSGMLIFWLLQTIFNSERVAKSDRKQFIIAAFFGVAMNQLLFFKGLSLTSEIHSALIMITTPILVLLMAWFILKDKITIRKTTGIIIGAIGVSLLITSGARDAASPASWTGDLCIMTNAASYAIFLVIAKPLMKKYAPLTLARWIFFYGFFMVLPFGIPDLLHADWQSITFIQTSSIIYVVLGATVLAYLFNILGLHHGNPTLVSIYIYTQPVIATLIAVGLGSDTLNAPKVISALLVFIGVALVSFTKDIPPLKAGV